MEFNRWYVSVYSHTLPKHQASSDDAVEMRADGAGSMLLSGSGGGILARNEGVRFLFVTVLPLHILKCCRFFLFWF